MTIENRTCINNNLLSRKQRSFLATSLGNPCLYIKLLFQPLTFRRLQNHYDGFSFKNFIYLTIDLL